MMGPTNKGKKLRLTRSSLIKRLPDWEDADSWQEFYDTYWRLIFNSALRKGLTRTEAEEVLQNTLLKISKNIHKFKRGKERGSFTAWLCKTTGWLINDQFRKRRPEEIQPEHVRKDQETRTDPIERLPDPSISQETWTRDWEENLLQVALERAKRAVEPLVFQLFDLHARQAWTASKVADRLGVKLSQVYSAKYKVSEILKKEVDRLRKEMF